MVTQRQTLWLFLIGKQNNPIVLEWFLGKIENLVDPTCNSYSETSKQKNDIYVQNGVKVDSTFKV